MHGYAGRFLDINLSTGNIQIRPFDPYLAVNYLGGVGFNTRFLFDRIKPDTDPLGPHNLLIFNTGTLTGTSVPTAARTEASALSPLTGRFGTSNSGHYWGATLKFAGYDGLVIRGKATEPVYIYIDNQHVSILPANQLWGRDAWETIKYLRAHHANPHLQVACIGPAGENKVRFASIENGPFDAWARTGLGAVMGSKNLKAIAVHGSGTVSIASPREFLQAVRDMRRAIYSSPFYGAFARYGTMLVTIPYYEFGILPGRNFQTGLLANWLETRSRKLIPVLSQRGISCITCPIACAHWVEIEEGPFAGLKIKDLEVTPVLGFGAGCDLADLKAIAKLTEICQRMGLDMVSAAATVAFAIELFQNGLLKESDTGFPLAWGDFNTISQLLYQIAYRQGIGALLAEGTARAAAHIPGAEDYLCTIKGMECFLFDPRGRFSTWTLGFITNTRGGDHLRTRSPVENLRFNDNPQPYLTEKFALGEEVYQKLDMPAELKQQIFDPVTRDVNIPRMAKWSEDLITVYNALGVCIRPPVLQAVGPTLLARLYSSLTGMEMNSTEIMQAGERIWNLQKLFNLRRGEKPEESDFPRRFYRTALQGGPNEGKTLDPTGVRRALQEYYSARGWDENGHPTEAKLTALDLNAEITNG